jgi:hypothetical protein
MKKREAAARNIAANLIGYERRKKRGADRNQTPQPCIGRLTNGYDDRR